jgi:hypothetical protein
MKNTTKLLIKALRTYARPPFAQSAKDDKRIKYNTGPFTGAKPERDARAKELKALKQKCGSKAVRIAERHYLAGRTSHGNNKLGLPTIIAAYCH